MRPLSVGLVITVLVVACTVGQDLDVAASATTAGTGTSSPAAAVFDAAEGRIGELERIVDRLRDENQDLKDAVARLESALGAGTGDDSTSEPVAMCPQPDGEFGENQAVVLLYLTCGPMMSDSTRGLAGLVPVGRAVDDGEEMLTAALGALLSGMTANEEAAGYSSWFSSATADALLSVGVVDDRAMINLDAGSITSLNNVSTSTGGAYFRGQLYGTVFANAAVNSVEFQLDGEPGGFCGLMELVSDCTPITRSEWNRELTR